jgi:hypothetical protein
MKHGWKYLCAGLAIATIAALHPVAADAAKPAASAGTSSAKKSMRQYTGWVTSLDKTSITVEKRGKKPENKVFSKHAEMNTTGDLEKDAHVTVYYRDEAGRPVAHKVVVKTAPIAGR